MEGIAALGVNLVLGTTGWLEHELARVSAAVEKNGIGLVWSPNYSIGVNVFFRLVSRSRAPAGGRAGIRRVGVGDPPLHQEGRAFGYAVEVGGGDEEGRIRARRIDVSSNRAGAHPGTHEIGFDSAADTITLRHTARSREGFARGALKAAQWVVGKKGFHEFSEVVFE